MLIIYTGNGKGKTSASVGQAIRAIGQGMRVFFAQFIKENVGAGEQIVLSRLLGDSYIAGGCGFFTNEAQRAEHRAAAEKTLDCCRTAINHSDMIIMDEALYALNAGLLTKKELTNIIDECRNLKIDLVLSGRGMPDWLRDKAELVTNMDEVKHPAQTGGNAVRGIEF